MIDRVEARRQGIDPELKARHTDGLHDLLRRVGDLTREEVAARFEGDSSSAIEEGLQSHRFAEVQMAEPRLIAAEDAGLYRDALGIKISDGLPAAFLERSASPLEQLLTRYARTHGPFETAKVATRFGIVPGQLDPVLASLSTRGKLIAGEFDPRGHEKEWVDPEILAAHQARHLGTPPRRNLTR